MKMFRRFESYIFRMVSIIERTVARFSGQPHSGEGMCLKIALWAYHREPRVDLLYNSWHVVCTIDDVVFDGSGIIECGHGYMNLWSFGQDYFQNGFGAYLTRKEQTILKQYFNMTLSKQIKDLENSIGVRTCFISEKQLEAQNTNKELQEARVAAQAAMQEWETKINGLTGSLNTIVQEITTSHEAKLREEGRLSLLQEQFEQSAEWHQKAEPATKD